MIFFSHARIGGRTGRLFAPWAAQDRRHALFSTRSAPDYVRRTERAQIAAGKGRQGVSVTLSWRLTLAVLGRGIYGSMPLAERRGLSETARLVHAWLACWFGAKRRGSIGVEALAGHGLQLGLEHPQ